MKITIFGLAGTGTSTVGKLLAEKLDFEFKSSGNIFREFASEINLSVYDFEKKINEDKTHKYDIELDERVSLYGKENNNFIFESRLAWHFIPDSIKIKLTCELDLSYKRVAEREEISFEEAKEKTIKRADELEQRYKDIYPDLVFPPKDEIFDLVVDTDELTPNEVRDTIVSFLESKKELNK